MDNWINNNITIAVFMGYKRKDEFTLITPAGSEIDRGRLVYHLSFDALIPVYNKIIDLFNNDQFVREKLSKSSFYMAILKGVFSYEMNTDRLSISKTYQKIIDLINFLNK